LSTHRLIADVHRQFEGYLESDPTLGYGYIVEVWDEYVIAMFGDLFYRINYTTDEPGDVMFTPRAMWEPVEQPNPEWQEAAEAEMKRRKPQEANPSETGSAPVSKDAEDEDDIEDAFTTELTNLFMMLS
jgi:hypothetical protein